MRTFKIASCILTLMTTILTGVILTSNKAAAGQTTGNGGGAWVCREPNGSIRWSKLVDLFEATDEFGLTLKRYSGSTQEIVEQVNSRIAEANQNFFFEITPYLRDLNYLKPNPPFVTHTNHIVQTIDDSLYRIKPAPVECTDGSVAYEQVVNYKNDGYILVEGTLFNSEAFDSNTQAALILHEAIYKYRREVRLDRDSVVTRRIVGLIFSNLPAEDLKKQLGALGESETRNLGMKFTQLQPGTFIMGSAESWLEMKPHPVTLTHPFEMQTTTVTQSQYVQLMGVNPSFFSKPEFCEKSYEVRDRVPMCPNHPVDSVTYNEALTFIAKLNDMQGGKYLYRLPTEAEWEYAARGGTNTVYFFGNSFYGKDGKAFDDYGWFDTNTHEVAQKIPNPYGLYDMLGNVSQWTSEWYGKYQGGPTTDPTGPSSGTFRVSRPAGCGGMGNDWTSGVQSETSAARTWASPAVGSKCRGFRLVRVRRD